MRLTLYCIGRLSEPWLQAGVAEYAGRIGRYLGFTEVELKEEKGGRKHDQRLIREHEGERLLARLPAKAFTIVLDEGGRQFSSEMLADLLGKQMLDGTGEVALVIGGAYGLSDAVKARADLLLSLSALTLTHQMARLLLCEQLYRGLTILRNEPYHNR
ncbi:23S rRNA (pseudouridine(1915)-N(3))-methyltransferase RlmH [Desulfuromonas carbonis]|uniref:23S rRNA (pseudouridine(1915)-N(3))-methyltransferase RlmH n=1 Tax=Desulfuromonas sp. DDH964 TaxID=1823759 RepID=UPI00078C8599|nr:23S rRNA (pseudouridine(1915)-N(3))-methyltransferase RlmH [Desulfuromonas sp. DDH964]AMV71154.1 23S rRNA (3-N-methyl-pseudoU1915)-methyltransferase [Desulfuromonas sp. DDH964]